MSLNLMSHVELKKFPCRCVKFRGLGPLTHTHGSPMHPQHHLPVRGVTSVARTACQTENVLQAMNCCPTKGNCSVGTFNIFLSCGRDPQAFKQYHCLPLVLGLSLEGSGNVQAPASAGGLCICCQDFLSNSTCSTLAAPIWPTHYTTRECVRTGQKGGGRGGEGVEGGMRVA